MNDKNHINGVDDALDEFEIVEAQVEYAQKVVDLQRLVRNNLDLADGAGADYMIEVISDGNKDDEKLITIEFVQEYGDDDLFEIDVDESDYSGRELYFDPKDLTTHNFRADEYSNAVESSKQSVRVAYLASRNLCKKISPYSLLYAT